MTAEEQSASRVVDFEAYVTERRPALLRWARAVAGDSVDVGTIIRRRWYCLA